MLCSEKRILFVNEYIELFCVRVFLHKCTGIRVQACGVKRSTPDIMFQEKIWLILYTISYRAGVHWVCFSIQLVNLEIYLSPLPQFNIPSIYQHSQIFYLEAGEQIQFFVLAWQAFCSPTHLSRPCNYLFMWAATEINEILQVE